MYAYEYQAEINRLKEKNEQLRRKLRHNGCANCRFESKTAHEYPCNTCKGCYLDKWEPKTKLYIEKERE